MPDPPDNAETCCVIGVCCNEAKRRAALSKQLRANDPHLSQHEADKAADFIHDTYDLLPKAWGFGKAFYKRDEAVRDSPPYE